jgi:hypothetical protein
MDPRNGKNATQDSVDHDVDFYLKHDSIPVDQIRTILKHKKLSDEKIDDFISKVVDTRTKVQKYARKFINRVDQHYGMHDIPTIVKKAAKFAEKHALTTTERDAVVSMAMKGDVANSFNPTNELKYTEMAKFMGVETQAGQVLNLSNKDYAPLNEITKMFELTRTLHADVKNQLALYRDCAPEAVTGTFDKTKNNLSTHIHPVLVALFLPKIEAIEKRMLYTNIGRIVLQRALPYIDRHIALHDNILNGELEAEWELTYDIVKDPNSLAYFSDDTPITNMMKRFKIQIELWKNVLSLRQGKYYASDYSEEGGINGFLRVLSQYDWSFFDSPDMFHVQDEGTVLRKLLAVFSLRPTFAQISSLTNKTIMGYSNFAGLARTSFLNIPIVNVKLPTLLTNLPNGTIHINNALSQSDWYIDRRQLTPKNKNVIYTRDLIFFYANRRYQSVNIANLSLGFRYQSVPMQSWNVGHTAVNETPLNFDDSITIGKDVLNLRSVVMIYKPPVMDHVSVGASAVVVKNVGPGIPAPIYLHYNPVLANFQTWNASVGGYTANKPITALPAVSAPGSGIENFQDNARKFGTIFLYSK